jgi:hypothetical protein
MNDTFFHTESAHSNIMYWWHGVIVDDKYWAGCTDSDISNNNSKIHPAKQLEERPKKGWGYRYKVAVVGRHYALKKNPDEADLLEMAEVVYPVTAGSGLGGTKQTAALRQGTHVIGFYADGKEGNHPVILGCFGVNEQNEPIIYQGDSPEFFKLRSANKGQCGEKLKPVPEKNQNENGGGGKTICIESCDPLTLSKKCNTKGLDGCAPPDPILKPKKCETPGDIISNIKLLLTKLSYYANLAKRGASDLVSSAEGIIKSITRAISSLTNTLLDRARGYIINKINNGIKDVMNFLPPFLRPGFNVKATGILGRLSCAFNNIKDKISGVASDLVDQFIDNYVNAPLCAATSFLGGLLGNVIGEINGAIDSAVSAINSLLNIGTGYVDKALDVLELALDILKLFECDKDEAKCPDTTKWSFWTGPRDLEFQVAEGAKRTIKNIISEVETVLPGSEKGTTSNPCNSRQVPCGPPRIQIAGGGGSGASANAVVNSVGAILGLDFSSFGSGYIREPQIRVVDSCGTGGGAVIVPIMKPTGTFNEFNEEFLDLQGAIVLDSGTQYLPAPNGTTGGSGFIFSQPSDTIHFKTGTTKVINGKTVNGTGYDVYKCGTTFDVVVGDEVYLPSGTVANITNENNQIIQSLNGLGQISKITIEVSGKLTAPCNPDNVPTTPQIDYPLSSGITTSGSGPSTYSVVPVIKDVIIKNPGFSYTDNDNIGIMNGKGTELDFKVNERGEVTEVIILNKGIGFNEVPYIFIESPTGFNFEAVAVFDFVPLSSIDINNINPPPGARIISVVDCVGKVNE